MDEQRYPSPLDAGVARIVAQLRGDAREAFEERSAIMEYDGGLRRLDAERQALIQTLSQYGLLGASQLRLLRVDTPRSVRFALVETATTPWRFDGPEVDALTTLRASFGSAAWLVPAR